MPKVFIACRRPLRSFAAIFPRHSREPLLRQGRGPRGWEGAKLVEHDAQLKKALPKAVAKKIEGEFIEALVLTGENRWEEADWNVDGVGPHDEGPHDHLCDGIARLLARESDGVAYGRGEVILDALLTPEEPDEWALRVRVADQKLVEECLPGWRSGEHHDRMWALAQLLGSDSYSDKQPLGKALVEESLERSVDDRRPFLIALRFLKWGEAATEIQRLAQDDPYAAEVAGELREAAERMGIWEGWQSEVDDILVGPKEG